MICPYCEKEVKVFKDGSDYRMVALDRPYVNLFFHRDCFINLENDGDLFAFLTKNTEKWYNYNEK
jgi:hypothetical protein